MKVKQFFMLLPVSVTLFYLSNHFIGPKGHKNASASAAHWQNLGTLDDGTGATCLQIQHHIFASSENIYVMCLDDVGTYCLDGNMNRRTWDSECQSAQDWIVTEAAKKGV